MATAELVPPKGRTRRTTVNSRRLSVTGWLFILPFVVVFLLFLVVPLVYAFYLSLFVKGLATGTAFAGFDNYLLAIKDSSFVSSVWWVARFAAVLIPVQMVVSLAMALILDAFTTRLARFARLVIFLPYAVPAVIGAVMWGFLYSPVFGPLEGIFGSVGLTAPVVFSPDGIFGGLVNIVTWQWAGYYMIILYAALQGIDPSLYEAARVDGASSWQVAFRIKVPLITNALILVLVFALIGTLQFFTEPQVIRPLANGAVTTDLTPNIYAYNVAFAFAQFNYASALSFALGIVVFVCVYIFLFATRKRGNLFQ